MKGKTLEILAHRGWWLNREERNSTVAFERAFEAGYGVETDLRDRDGTVVVSHDPANGSCATFDDFLNLYLKYPTRPTLALNIKADGLVASVKQALAQHGVESYFLFDMSVPDSLHYLNAELRTFTRRSEFEPPSALEARAQGIWLDSFQGDFISIVQILSCIELTPEVAIVSPELHGRPHVEMWKAWAPLLTAPPAGARVSLCTDFPEEAEVFFNRVGGCR